MELTNSSAIVTTHQTAVTPTQTTCPALAYNTTQPASLYCLLYMDSGQNINTNVISRGHSVHECRLQE